MITEKSMVIKKNIVLIDKIEKKYTNSSLSTKRYYFENRAGPVSTDLFCKCIKNNYHITYGEGSVPKFIAKLIL